MHSFFNAGLRPTPPPSLKLRRAVPVRGAFAAVVSVALLAAACSSPAPSSSLEDEVLARARAIHERVITLDTHNDIEVENFTAEKNYAQRLDTQVNLPKMREGGLDASVLVVYTGQGPLTDEGYADAYTEALAKFDAIHRLVDEYAPDMVGLALTPDDVRAIAGSGKKVVIIGVENGYPIGTDVSRVKEFYDRGARTLSLSHNGHNQLSDSNTGERDGEYPNHGLSALGRQVVAEANRLGIVLDVSHVSRDSMMQTVELSKAPIIASHSSVRALCDNSRNLDNEQLKAMAARGGVAQMVALSSYVKTPPPDSPERAEAMTKLREEFGLPAPGARRRDPAGALATLTPERRAELMRRYQALNEQFPVPRATVKDFVDHIDYAVKLVGIDHVGISSDFDGGGGVEGWNGADETFNVTLELVRRGYTEEQIGKLWSGNVLRVMTEAQRIAKEIQGT
jgi:membrane dipeptidase